MLAHTCSVCLRYNPPFHQVIPRFHVKHYARVVPSYFFVFKYAKH